MQIAVAELLEFGEGACFPCGDAAFAVVQKKLRAVRVAVAADGGGHEGKGNPGPSVACGGGDIGAVRQQQRGQEAVWDKAHGHDARNYSRL